MSEYVIMPKADYVAACDAIRAKTGKTDLIKSGDMKPEILGITTGGGSSEDVRYVTFMSEDGTVELGKKAVATGDDCADPIARGVFSTPTKESTAQYNYTFYSWATTPNGAADSNWNKAVTEDRTVYANFAAVVRYYTITYYDSDGTTVLKTESIAFGSLPNYTPVKGEHDFSGWNPTPVAVTGDTSYTAIWKTKATFATATWAEIAEVCNSGNASTTFKVGDEKAFTLTYTDGTTEENAFVVAGFNSKMLEDGSNANMTLVTKYALKNKRAIMDSYVNSYNYFKNSHLKTWLNGVFLNALPADLQSHIKNKNIDTSDFMPAVCKCWIPSVEELNFSKTGFDMYALTSSPLPLFSSNSKRIRTLGSSGAATTYLTRSQKSGTSKGSGQFAYITETGELYGGSGNSGAATETTKHGIVVGICI